MSSIREGLVNELGHVTGRRNPDPARVAAIQAEIDKLPEEEAAVEEPVEDAAAEESEDAEVETAAVEAPETTAKRKPRKATAG